MVELINLSKTFNVDGKTVSSQGVASGINTQEMLEVAKDAKQAPIEQLSSRLKSEEAKKEAWIEMQGYMGALQDNLTSLKRSYYFNEVDENVFASRTALASVSWESDAGNVYMSVKNGADLGRYKIKVDQLARAQKWQSRSFSSISSGSIVQAPGDHTDTATKFTAGTFKVAVQNNAIKSDIFSSPTQSATNPALHSGNSFGSGKVHLEGYSIEVQDGDSLNDIAEKFNNISEYTGTNAKVEDYSGGYVLVLYSEKSGIENQFQVTGNPSTLNGQFDREQPSSEWTDWQDISVTQDDSLYAIYSQINNYSDTTGLSANIMEIDSGEYKLMLNSIWTGVGNAFKIDDSVDNVFNDIFTNDDRQEQSRLFADKTDPIVLVDHSLPDSQFTAGTFQINGVDITLSAGDTLEQVRDKINAVSGASKIDAAIVEEPGAGFRLNLTAQDNGVIGDAATFTITDNDSVLNELFTDNANYESDARNFVTEIAQAQDSEITLDGLKIRRASNIIDDVFAKNRVSFRIHNTTEQEVIFEVVPDVVSVKEKIQAFVEQYNQLSKFITRQQLRDKQTNQPLESAKLINNSLLNEINFSLQQFVNAQTTGSNSTVRSLADLGIVATGEEPITIEREGKETTLKGQQYQGLLEFDVKKLDHALTNNFNEVRRVFEFNFQSTSNNFFVGSDRKNIPLDILNKIDSIDIDVDLKRAVTKTTASRIFTDATSDVVNAAGDHSNPTTRFTAGTFLLNGAEIVIGEHDSLNKICETINSSSVSVVASVQNTNGDYRLELEPAKTGVAIEIIDKDGVLNKIFDVDPKWQESVNYAATNTSITNPVGDHSDTGKLTPGSFEINGVAITVEDGDTLEQFKDKINSAEDINVTASIVTIGTEYKLHLEEEIPVLQGTGYKINDPDNVLNLVLGTANIDNRGERFYDTTHVAKAKLKTQNGSIVNKVVHYQLSKDRDNLHSTAKLSVLDFESDAISGKNIEFYCYASKSNQFSSTIAISQGVADTLYNYTKLITEPRGLIYHEMQDIDTSTQRLETDIQKKQGRVDREMAALRQKYAKLEATVLTLNQALSYLELLTNNDNKK